MGLGQPDRSRPPPRADAPPEQASKRRNDDSALLELLRHRPVFQRWKAVPLRCVDINPRHLTLAKLERDDCRYPYGGELEGDAVTFCGHRRRKGSSYCTPHFHLTRNPDAPTERAARIAPFRLVAATGIYRVEKFGDGTQEAQEAL